MGDDGGAPLISPDGVAPSHIACLPLLSSTTKVQKFFFWHQLTPGGPGKRAIKRLCVCDVLQKMQVNNISSGRPKVTTSDGWFLQNHNVHLLPIMIVNILL